VPEIYQRNENALEYIPRCKRKRVLTPRLHYTGRERGIVLEKKFAEGERKGRANERRELKVATNEYDFRFEWHSSIIRARELVTIIYLTTLWFAATCPT